MSLPCHRCKGSSSFSTLFAISFVVILGSLFIGSQTVDAQTTTTSTTELNLYNVTQASCASVGGMQYYNLTVSSWPADTPAQHMVIMFRTSMTPPSQWTAYASLTTAQPSSKNSNWSIQADTASGSNSLGGEIWIPMQPIGTVIYLSFDCSTVLPVFNYTVEPVIPTFSVFQNKATNYYVANIQDSGVHANWFAFNTSMFTNNNILAWAMRTELCQSPANIYTANTRVVFPGVTETSACGPSSDGIGGMIYSFSNWNTQWIVGQNLQTDIYKGIVYVYVAITHYNSNYLLELLPSRYSIILAGSINNWNGTGTNAWGVLAAPPEWTPLQINNDLYLIPTSQNLFPWDQSQVNVYYSLNQSNSMWLGSLCYLQTHPSDVIAYNGPWDNSVSNPLRFNNFQGLVAPGFFDNVTYLSSYPYQLSIGINNANLVPLPPFSGSVTSIQPSLFTTTTIVIIAVLASIAAILFIISIVTFIKYSQQRKQYERV